MPRQELLIVALLLTVITSLVLQVAQTGAPQALVHDLDNTVGVFITAVTMQETTATLDYWGAPYQREVVDGALVVLSYGPDKLPNTRDDLRVVLGPV